MFHHGPFLLSTPHSPISGDFFPWHVVHSFLQAYSTSSTKSEKLRHRWKALYRNHSVISYLTAANFLFNLFNLGHSDSRKCWFLWMEYFYSPLVNNSRFIVRWHGRKWRCKEVREMRCPYLANHPCLSPAAPPQTERLSPQSVTFPSIPILWSRRSSCNKYKVLVSQTLQHWHFVTCRMAE